MATVSGTATDLKKRKLKIRSGDGLSYTFKYAPTNISYQGGNRIWNESTRPGRISNYVHGAITGRTASFTTDVVNVDKTSVNPQVNTLKKLSRTKSYVLMEYTASESGVWVIVDFAYEVIRRNTNHNPYHVQVSFTLQEISSDVLPKAPTSGGKSSTSKSTSSSSSSTSKKVKKYTVKKNDTLWGISLKFYGTGKKWTKIADKNKIKNPKRLKVGTVLRIP